MTAMQDGKVLVKLGRDRPQNGGLVREIPG